MIYLLCCLTVMLTYYLACNPRALFSRAYLRGGGGSGGSNPPEIFRFFLKSEGKEIERKRKKEMLGGGGGLPLNIFLGLIFF